MVIQEKWHNDALPVRRVRTAAAGKKLAAILSDESLALYSKVFGHGIYLHY